MVTVIIGVPVVTGFIIPFLLIGIHFLFLYLVPLIVLGGVIIHEHPIKFPVYVVLDTLPPVQAILSNFILIIFDALRIKVAQSLNIIIVGVLSFNIVASTACFFDWG